MNDETFSPYKRHFGCLIPNELLKFEELSLTDKVVWGRLAQYAGDREFCFPKQETLANELSISVRSVRRSLVVLEELKFLKVEQPSSIAKMKRQGNKYYFLKHSIFQKFSGDNLTHDSGDKLTHEGSRRSSARTKSGTKSLSGDNLTLQEENQKTKENQEAIKTKTFVDVLLKEYETNDELLSAWDSFAQTRKDKRNPITRNIANLIVTQLVKYTNDAETATQIILQSARNGWLDVYPLKQNNNSARGRTIKPGQGTKDYGYDTLKKNDRVIDNSEFM